MWWFLVLLGILIAFAGLSVIALGISIFVSTFGNTLITTGAVAASGGFVITAMGLVLRQMERLSQRIETAIERGRMDERPAAETEPGSEGLPPALRRSAPLPFPPREDMPEAEPIAAEREPQTEPTLETAATAESEQPSRVESRLPPVRERMKPELRAPRRPAESPAPAQPAAEEAPAARAPLPPRVAEVPAAMDPMLQARRERLERRGEVPPAAEPERAAPAPARPQTGYELPPRAPRPQEAPAMPAPIPETEAEAAATPEEPRILKSGIVGGMAYTLYSDGSIQAELPDGVVRFASLQELRDHVARAQQMR